MGQTRSDTPEQRAAKRDGAERRKCPECGRKNALSKGYAEGSVPIRYCRYCDYFRLRHGGRDWPS